MRRRTRELAPILEVIPAELRREASPERCVCKVCRPDLDDVERTAEREMHAAWRDARASWCRDNGYGVMDLMLGERPRLRPGKQRREVES